MSKYHSDDEIIGKRVDKNKERYKESRDVDLDNLNLANNVSIITTENENPDIEEIQGLLKKKYVAPRDKHPIDFIELDNVDLEVTKEYKLKDAIDKAFSEKDDDYEKNRYKKLRNTEYEILKSINVEKSESESTSTGGSNEGEIITSLLKIIDEKTPNNKKDELLSDLISDGTDVLEPIKQDTDELSITPPKPTLVEELERTKQLSKKQIIDELEKVNKEEKTQEKFADTTSANTFYTGNLAIEDADLEDFKDLENEMKSNGILVKLLIILLVLAVLVVAVYLLNKYLNLGLF